MFASRTDGDDGDGGADEFFDEGDVASGGFWEVFDGACVGEVALEAVELGVDGLDAVELSGVGDEAVGGGAVGELVGGADVELVEVLEDIEEHDGERGDAVDHDGVAGGDEVEPTAASGSAGGGAVFVAGVADAFGDRALELGGEGPRADACVVGLHDADDGVDSRGGDAGAGGYAGGGAGGGGDVGEGAVVEVEEGGVGAFEEDAFALSESFVEVVDGVGDHGSEGFAGVCEGVGDGVGVDGGGVFAEGVGGVGGVLALGERAEEGGFVFAEVADFLSECVTVEEFAHADGGGASGFVGVGGPDAATCGADAFGAGACEPGFGESVLSFVVGSDDVGAIGDEEGGGGVGRVARCVDGDAAFAEGGEFFDELEGIDDDAVADDGFDASAEDA